MRQSTLDKWVPIFENYDPEKHGSQQHYCESIGVSYNQYKVYKHRMLKDQKNGKLPIQDTVSKSKEPNQKTSSSNETD